MNITYDMLDTGIMRLKFKDHVIDAFKDDTKEILDKYILPMMAMNEKFVLTGSLSLKLLGFEPIDKVGDIDIGLLDTFTEEEWIAFKNFFGLVSHQSEMYNHSETDYLDKKFDPKAHMWQFHKQWFVDESDSIQRPVRLKIDIFNDEILRKRDIIEVYLGDFPLRLVHPSITYSYRMRYALDVRGNTAFKYWERIKSFMDNAKEYYTTLRTLYRMIARVYEHNTAVEGNKEKIEKLRVLVNRREEYADNFFEKVFKETIDPFTLTMEREAELFGMQQALRNQNQDQIKTVSKITL
jgi:hypothetical protein